MRVTRTGTDSDAGDLALSFIVLLALAAAALSTMIGVMR